MVERHLPDGFVIKKKEIDLLKRIYNILTATERKECMRQTIYVLAQSLLNFAGLASIFPVLKAVIEKDNDTRSTMLMMGAVLAFIVFKNLLSTWLTRQQTNFLMEEYRQFSYKLFVRYYQMGLLFIKEKGPVQIANDINSLCLIFSMNVLKSILSIAGEAVLITMVAAALFFMSPLAALLLLMAALPLTSFYVFVLRDKMQKYGKDDMQARRQQARTVVETFRGFSELEISGAFESQLNRFMTGIDVISNSRKKLELMHAMPSFLSEVAIIVGLAMLLLVSDGDQVLIGGTFALAAFRLMPSFRNVLNSWTSLQQASYSIDTLENEFVEESKAEKDCELKFEDALTAEHISFAYPNADYVICDFSCKIKKGECIGIKGASGSGKSTLFNILLGFYQTQSGKVTVDGTEISRDNVKAWHKHIGYVPQSIFISHGTLAQNIALGSERIDEKRIMEVLEQAQLKEWFDTLPEGLNTQMGESGSRLSGGQKQRIGIARALYMSPDILFFDEATSALDNKTEQEITQTLQSLSENHKELTMVVIAHRDTSLTFCDRIIDLTENE